MIDLTAIRRKIIETSFFAQEGHIPSALSIVEILAALYDHILPEEIDSRFILSKGHGVLAQYAVMAEKKIIPELWWQRFCQANSYYEGHPNHRCPGIEFSTGSLGHGFPLAAGLALGLKIQSRPGRVFCLVGDEECNEGSIWETAQLAYALRLYKLVVIVDDNRSSPQPMLDIAKKFKAFGWQTHEVDGHDVSSLKHALREKSNSLPTCIVARTTKGHGCEPMREKAWHHKSPTSDQMPALMRAVK